MIVEGRYTFRGLREGLVCIEGRWKEGEGRMGFPDNQPDMLGIREGMDMCTAGP